MKKYFTDIFSGIWNLLKGMKITGKVLVSPAVTECYPEKRDELQPKERFRAELTMPHNENNEHKCTACGICAMNCPNQTITVKKSKITDENGKPKIYWTNTSTTLAAVFSAAFVPECVHKALLSSPTTSSTQSTPAAS